MEGKKRRDLKKQRREYVRFCLLHDRDIKTYKDWLKDLNQKTPEQLNLFKKLKEEKTNMYDE